MLQSILSPTAPSIGPAQSKGFVLTWAPSWALTRDQAKGEVTIPPQGGKEGWGTTASLSAGSLSRGELPLSILQNDPWRLLYRIKPGSLTVFWMKISASGLKMPIVNFYKQQIRISNLQRSCFLFLSCVQTTPRWDISHRAWTEARGSREDPGPRNTSGTRWKIFQGVGHHI